jgi:hypothetical protein
MQSFFADFEAKPSEAVQGRLSLSVLGNVAVNPIDEIFYENRGRAQALVNAEGDVVEIQSLERVKVYQAAVSWDDRYFMLDYFYRTGHLHWQYEGDFFGLYRDAYYGPNIDIYNGNAPNGVQMSGKKALQGFTVAFGPELWWGANPAVFLKYRRALGGITWTGLYQDDFAQRTQTTSTIAIPTLQTRKASLQMATRLGPFDAEGGALWSGTLQVGETFQMMADPDLNNVGDVATPEDIRQDTVKDEDTFGFRGKLIWQKGRWNWYGQGAYMGLVAEAGPTAIPTFTGWTLKDSGSGNQVNALTGLMVGLGKWTVGPNFLWQKPIVGPMLDAQGLAGTPGHVRSIITDPFSVLGNREMAAGEIMITYDPTPATWMWGWDSNLREDAKMAASLGFVFRHHYTTADANLYISAEDNLYAFNGNTPARDLWEVNSQIFNRFGRTTRMNTKIWFGTAEPTGDDQRLVHRFGAESRIAWPGLALAGFLKFNDYGPYDYHHNFNLTFPLQVMADVSVTLGRPLWFDLPQTSVGVRGTFRTLDRYSNRYQPSGVPAPAEGEDYPAGLPGGNEWEIRTYVNFAI